MAVNNQIGSGAIVLTTSADSLAAGLAKAEHDVTAWGNHTAAAVQAGPLGKAAGKGGLFSGLGGMVLAGGAAGLGLAAAQSLIRAGQAAYEKFQLLGEGIDKASKSARALGTDMGTFQGIAHAADLSGVGIEELEAGLAKFRRQVSGPLDAALYGFAERLEGIQDPGERAKLLVENFGKSGLRLAGLFEGGKAGLEEMVAEAKRLGIALSDADGKAIEEANDSITRAKRSIDGLWNKVGVALAPGLERAGTFLTDMAVKMQPVFDWIGRDISMQIELWGGFFEVVSSGVREMVQGIADFAGELTGLAVNEIPAVEQVVKATWRAIAITGAHAFDTIAAGMGLVAVGASKLVDGFGEVVDAFKDVVGLAKQLPESLRPEGLNELIAGMERLKKGSGDAGKNLDAWGKKQIENFLNEEHAKRVREWFDNLGKKKAAEPKLGLPGIAPTDAGASLAGAIEANTKDAFEVTLRARGFEIGDREGQQRKTNEKLDQSNRLAEKQNETLGRMAAAWEGGF